MNNVFMMHLDILDYQGRIRKGCVCVCVCV